MRKEIVTGGMTFSRTLYFFTFPLTHMTYHILFILSRGADGKSFICPGCLTDTEPEDARTVTIPGGDSGPSPVTLCQDCHKDF